MTKVLNNISFDWKKLQIYLFSQHGLDFQSQLQEELQRYPDLLYRENNVSLDEQKRISAKTVFVLYVLRKRFFQNISTNEKLQKLWIYALYSIMPSAGVQFGIADAVFPNALRRFGTERHMNMWKMAVEGKIVGGFCLTEIGHGSNAKMIQTTASFDATNNEFILNTPNFEAAKCWAGNVGMIATHVIVHAQLLMPDEENQGLHMFVVPLRDPETFQSYSGVTVGDMGEKIGLNGVDNGFVLFNNYRIPKTCLLNKLADVDDKGRYTRRVSSKKKQFGVTMGVLTKGRILIIGIINNYMLHAVTVALRFVAIKNNKNSDNTCMLDHQYIQRSLLPYLSVAYVTDIMIDHFLAVQNRFVKHESVLKLADIGIELHAVTSSAKALTAWNVRNGIQECKEACGDLSDLIATNDVNLTYEGESHVLIQQTSNWLLKLWPLMLNHEKIDYPLQSINFLNDALKILQWKFNIMSLSDFLDPQNILLHFQWLVCFLLKESYDKFTRLRSTVGGFWAKSDSQVYFCKTLAVAYVQAYIIRQVHTSILKSPDDIKLILSRVLSLYGIWCLEKHLPFFYKGGYASSGKLVQFTKEGILQLCKDLKEDVMDLVNAIAPPKVFTNLILGYSQMKTTLNNKIDPSFVSYNIKLSKL